MRRLVTVGILVLASAIGASAQVNTINTVAGGGAEPSAATSAYLPQPYDAVRDASGNTYISVPTLYAVFKVDTSGNLTIYAGTGIGGFSGDGGAATSAQLLFPEGLAIDKNGNLFIADMYNERIRRVDATTHIITTVAGSEDPYYGNYAGDGGAATNARLNGPEGVAVDANGDLFIADTNNGVIREVNASTQNISTYAGGGSTFGCPSGPASAAGFAIPTSVAVDPDGNVFVSDQSLDIVCKITTSQTISVYAGTLNSPGTPGQPNGDGGAATSAKLLLPRGLATDPTGNVYITEAGEPKIREVAASNGVISTVAGIGLICGIGGITPAEPGCGDGGAATNAAFDFPESVFYDSLGNLVVTDTYDMRVRVIGNGTNPTVNALAGGGTGGDGGAGTNGILGLPQYVGVDASENVYALESNGERLRELNASTNDLSTVAGDGYGGATISCNGSSCSSGPANGDGGAATQARFINPDSLAIDANGDYYILDYSTAEVRLVNKQSSAITVAGVTIQPGDIATIAGNGAACGTSGNPNSTPNCGDGGLATSASLLQPYAIAVDASGIVYVGDAGLSTVRAINTGSSAVMIAGVQIAAGNIATIAGIPGSQCSTYITNLCGDGGPATSAMLSFPLGLAASGTDLYIADAGDNVIRDVSLETGSITQYAFDGLPTFGGDDGEAILASMNGPSQLALDNRGNLYIGGGYDNVVRRVDASDGTVTTVAGDVDNLDGGFSGDGGPSTSALIGNYGLAIFNTTTPTDDLFISDTVSNRIRKVSLAPVTIADPSSGTPLTFGPALVGSTNNPGQYLDFANDGLDDLILTVKCNSCSPDFVLPAPNGPNNTYIFQVSPGNAGELSINFEPPVGTPTGTVTGTLTITTNDKANPSFTFPLSGTVTGAETLNVNVNPAPGSGSGGSVSSSPSGSPQGIFCSSDFPAGPPYNYCSASFAAGTSVTLFASPDSGYAFSSWNTANAPDASSCNGSATQTCTFTITGPDTVNASFTTSSTLNSYTISVVGYGNGSGTVASSPSGINCTITSGVAGATGCSATFSSATAPEGVTLTSTAATGGSVFVGYLGSCTGGAPNPCATFPVTASVGAVFSGPPVAFSSGQVFLDVGPMVFALNPSTGAVVQVLINGTSQEHQRGMTFDSVGNLYIAEGDGDLSVFSNQASGPTQFGNYGGSDAGYSVVTDPLGNVLLGNLPDFMPTLLEFAPDAGPTGAPSNTFYPAYDQQGPASFWIELLDSNDTIAYTLGSTTVKVFDLGESVQHPDIIPNPALTEGESLYALRELPDDSLLVAATDRIIRITQAGTVIKTYAPGTTAIFQNLNLDPDGVSFWTDDELTGTVYRVNIASGAVMNGGGYNTGLGLESLGFLQSISGIAVYGQPQSGGADVSVTMTAPGTATQNGNVTFTATIVNNGPLAATGVTLTDALPAGATFVSATSTVGSCSGTTTVTCALGTMANAATATVTIVATATQSGTLTNTVNVTSGVPDPNLTNNSATTNTTVSSGTPVSFNVTFTGLAIGTVTDNLGKIDCTATDSTSGSGTCSATYTSGTQVTLTATTPGTFGGFSGSPTVCSGSGNTCTVTLTTAETVTAGFSPGTSTFPLTVQAGSTHTGGGTITSTPAGINCTVVGTTTSGTCSANFGAGEFVTMNAAAGAGSTFFGWTGTTPSCITSSSVSCLVAMTAAETVDAGFTSGGGTVSVTVTGAGNVEDTSNPTSIDCTNTATGPQSGACSSGYAVGSAVTLTETPASGATFVSWGGGVCANPASTTCTFTVTTATTFAVTATFQTSTGGGLSFTSTTLTPGAVTIPYGADIPITGGTPPYTFAVTSGSSLPTGFSLDATASGTVAAGHVYNNAPNTAGTFTFGVTVTDSATPANVANATITLVIAATPPNTQPGLLNGQYAFLIRAYDESTATEHAVIGSFTFDGKGNITAGEIDNNGPGTNGIYNAQVTGVYSIGPDNRGVMSVTPTGETAGIFTIAVGNVAGGVASNATVTLFLDDNENSQIGSGILVKQNPTAFTQASFAGTYVFGLTGQDTTGNRGGELGFITFDNAGNITAATDDINNNGKMTSSSFTGVYTGPDSNGRIVQTNGSNTSPNDAIYLVSVNEGFALTIDPRATNGLLVGSGFRQATGTFSASSITGPDVLSVAGVSSTGTEAVVGLLTATAGASPTVSFTSDTNDGGNVTLNQTQTGGLTVQANGRTTLGFTTPVLVYLGGQDNGFVMSTDSSVSFGELVPQTGGPFSGTSLSGPYFLGQEEAVQGGVSAFSAVGSASGSNLALTADVSHAGGNLAFDQSLGSQTFSIGSNGHFTIPQGATAGALTGYLVSPTEAVFFDTSGPTTDPAPSTHPLLDVAQSVPGTSALAPVLSITKSHTGNFTQGQTGATYTVTVSNGANAGPTNGTVTVTENPPTGLTVTGMAGTGWTCETPSESVCVRSDALAAGASYPSVTVTVNVASNAPASITNSVTVSGGGSSSATATNPTTILSTTSLGITKTHTGNFTQGQQGATYTVTVSNGVNAAPTNGTVTVTENPPTGLTVTGMAGTGWTCQLPTASTCTRTDSLAAGASYPAITVTVNVASTASGSLTNSVTVSGGGSASATATDPTSIQAPPSLTVTKSHSGSFVQGLQGTYTVTVSNAAGSGPTTGTVTLTETPPAGLTVSTMSGTGWTCTTSACTRSDALSGGASYPAITVTVSVSQTAPSQLTNSVTVSGGGSASATASDPTNIVPPAPVATLNPANGSTVAFGGEGIGSSSAPQKVTITNSGNANLTVSNISISEESETPDFTQTNNCTAPLTPSPGTGSSCTINVVFTPTTTGALTATLNITSNDPVNPRQSLTLTGTGSTLSITVGPGGSTTVTVNPGGTAVYGLQLNAPPGTTGTATLSCTSPSATITCSVVPPQIVLTGKTVDTAIVVDTYCTSAAPVTKPLGKFPAGLIGMLCLLTALMLAAAPKAQRRRLRLALAPALLVAVLIVNAACGNLPKNPAGATQPGTYTLDITATLNNSSFTLPVTLIVK